MLMHILAAVSQDPKQQNLMILRKNYTNQKTNKDLKVKCIKVLKNMFNSRRICKKNKSLIKTRKLLKGKLHELTQPQKHFSLTNLNLSSYG